MAVFPHNFTSKEIWISYNFHGSWNIIILLTCSTIWKCKNHCLHHFADVPKTGCLLDLAHGVLWALREMQDQEVQTSTALQSLHLFSVFKFIFWRISVSLGREQSKELISSEYNCVPGINRHFTPVNSGTFHKTMREVCSFPSKDGKTEEEELMVLCAWCSAVTKLVSAGTETSSVWLHSNPTEGNYTPSNIMACHRIG